MIEKMWPCSAHDAFVTISEYHSGVMEGYLVHPKYEAPQPVRSVSHLIRLLDFAQKLETVSCKPLNYEEALFENPNKIASFTISVLFQQNHSIQGRVVWIERAAETVFRSALELIYLLDDILTVNSGENGEMKHE